MNTETAWSAIHTVFEDRGYWMDAQAVGRNNSRHGARIPHRQTERRVRSIHVGPQMRGVRPRTRSRTAYTRPPLRLGYPTGRCGETVAMFQVWSKEMHYKSFSAEKAAWLFAPTSLAGDERIRFWAPNRGLGSDALVGFRAARLRAFARSHACASIKSSIGSRFLAMHGRLPSSAFGYQRNNSRFCQETH